MGIDVVEGTAAAAVTVWLPVEAARELVVDQGRVELTTSADISGEYGPGLAYWQARVSLDVDDDTWLASEAQPVGPAGALVEVDAPAQGHVVVLTAAGFVLDLDRTANPIEVLDSMGGSEEAQYAQLLLDPGLMARTRRLVVVSEVDAQPGWSAVAGLDGICLDAILSRVADRDGDLVACDGEVQSDGDGHTDEGDLRPHPGQIASLWARLGFIPVAGGLWVRTTYEFVTVIGRD